MASKSLYAQAFEHFKNNNEDQLRAFVAFGLFVDAKHKWATSLEAWPTDAKCKQYHSCNLPIHSELYRNGADEVLVEFAQRVVETQRHQFLEQALDGYKKEAAKNHKSFWRGVAEATAGAFLWSVVLIVVAIIVGHLGIDVLGALERAAKP